MKNIQELIEKYGTGKNRKYTCSIHTDRNAAGMCEKCGKDLCAECIVSERGITLCTKCTSPFFRILSHISPWIKNPGLLLSAGLFILFAAYFSFGGQGGGITKELSPSFDKEKIKKRNQLFMKKGARLLLYADRLDKEMKTSRAVRSYKRAKFSFEEVVNGMEVQFDTHLSNVSSLTEINIRTRFANACIIIAQCCRKERAYNTAYEWLKEAIASKPAPATLGVAYFRAGLLYEEDMKNPAEAVKLYKEAHKKGSMSLEYVFNAALDKLLSMDRKELEVDSMLDILKGNADPAEAQYRIIMCYDKLGMKKEAASAFQEMKEEYPYSQWTKEISRTGIIPEDESEKSQEKETSPSSEEKEEEKLTITPLDNSQ